MMEVIKILKQLHFPLIFLGVQTVLGFLLCIVAGKWSLKRIAKIIGAEWGIIFGGLVGFLICENIWIVFAGAVAGILVGIVVTEVVPHGDKYLINFIFAFKCSYILVNPIWVWGYRAYLDRKYGAYELRGIKEDNYLLIVSLIVGAIFAVVVFKQTKLKYAEIFSTSFLGTSQILGVFSFAYVTELLEGPGHGDWFWSDWVHAFLPVMTVKYDNLLWGVAILAIAIGVYVKKKLWEELEQ